MVAMNLFAGQQWRNGHREQNYGQGGRGEERVRCMERVTWKRPLPYVKQIANGNVLMSQGTQTGFCINLEGWDGGGRGEGGSRGRGHMYNLWLIHADV